jgi:hypothetical protein
LIKNKALTAASDQRKCNSRRWERISDYSYPKPIAIRIYQSRLIDAALGDMRDERGNVIEYRLRPVAIESKEAR